ncbi:hypothetical protein ACA910_007117 [Epithemia clementina (nom. ined.)]
MVQTRGNNNNLNGKPPPPPPYGGAWNDHHRRTQSAPVDISQLLTLMAGNNNSNNHPTTAHHHQRTTSKAAFDPTSLFSQATVHESEAEKRILEALEVERQQRLKMRKASGGTSSSHHSNSNNSSAPKDPDFSSSLPEVAVPDGTNEDAVLYRYDQPPPPPPPPVTTAEDNDDDDHDDDDDDDNEFEDEEKEPPPQPDSANVKPPRPPPPPSQPEHRKKPSFSLGRHERTPSSLAQSTRYLLALQEMDYPTDDEKDEEFDDDDDDDDHDGEEKDDPRQSSSFRRDINPANSTATTTTTALLVDSLERTAAAASLAENGGGGGGIIMSSAVNRMTEAAAVVIKAAAAVNNSSNNNNNNNNNNPNNNNNNNPNNNNNNNNNPNHNDHKNHSSHAHNRHSNHSNNNESIHSNNNGSIHSNNGNNNQINNISAWTNKETLTSMVAQTNALFPHLDVEEEDQFKANSKYHRYGRNNAPIAVPASVNPNNKATAKDAEANNDNNDNDKTTQDPAQDTSFGPSHYYGDDYGTSDGGDGGGYYSGNQSVSSAGGRSSKSGGSRRSRKRNHHGKNAVNAVAREWDSLFDFFKPKRTRIWRELVHATVFCLLPSLGAALVLFHFVDNPPTGRCPNGADVSCGLDSKGKPQASISWWILFLGVRQIITWLIARGMDSWTIDWLLLQHPLVCRMLGPRVTLLLLQSKGWPSVLFWWCLIDAAVLYGEGSFPQHWLYWQNELKIFTRENPSGDITTNSWYRNIIIGGVILSFAVSLKRNYVGLHLGRRLYSRFHERLDASMKNIALISELAFWARNKRERRGSKARRFSLTLHKRHNHHRDTFRSSTVSNTQGSSELTNHSPHPNWTGGVGSAKLSHDNDTSEFQDMPQQQQQQQQQQPLEPGAVSGGTNKHGDGTTTPVTESPFPSSSGGSRTRYTSTGAGGGNSSDRVTSGSRDHATLDYDKILDPWNEPQRAGRMDVSGNQIVEFRQAFAIMTKPFFLSNAFGPVETREQCIKSSDKLFHRIRRIIGDGVSELPETIDLDKMTLMMYDGFHNEYERERADDLLDLIGPDSDGNINALEFVRAIDRVYKEVRLLENSILNASHIDREYERVINFLFYLALGCLFYSLLGLDLLTLILSLTSLIVAFSFMFGPGSAQLFEGVMLVLGRQPYDIGDRVAFDFTDAPANLNGSAHWLVEKIDLVSTTARLTATSELATFSNGAIARSRIINMNRSPDPFIYIYVRFETDVPYSTILIFKSTVQKFVQERPQEWQDTFAFRTNRIEAQQNFVEYMVVLQHRWSWQSLAYILEHKAVVETFCVELQKQMNCHYKAPSKPIHIRRKPGDADNNNNNNNTDQEPQEHHQEKEKQEELPSFMDFNNYGPMEQGPQRQQQQQQPPPPPPPFPTSYSARQLGEMAQNYESERTLITRNRVGTELSDMNDYDDNNNDNDKNNNNTII